MTVSRLVRLRPRIHQAPFTYVSNLLILIAGFASIFLIM